MTYGDNKIVLNIPEKNLAGVIEPNPANVSSDVLSGIVRVLDNPQGPRLSDISKGKRAEETIFFR